MRGLFYRAAICAAAICEGGGGGGADAAALVGMISRGDDSARAWDGHAQKLGGGCLRGDWSGLHM